MVAYRAEPALHTGGNLFVGETLPHQQEHLHLLPTQSALITLRSFHANILPSHGVAT